VIDEQFFYGGPFKEIVKAAVKEALAEEEGEEGPEIDIKTCLECDNTFIVCPLDMDDEPMDEPMDPGFCPFCGEAL
jgi:hypothetical protein